MHVNLAEMLTEKQPLRQGASVKIPFIVVIKKSNYNVKRGKIIRTKQMTDHEKFLT